MKRNGESGAPERSLSGGALETNAEVADTEEGWLKLEQEFQQSLMKAANSAEKKRGGIDWGGFNNRGNAAGEEGRNVYLASIASFKAFNLPFSIVGKALEPRGKNTDMHHDLPSCTCPPIYDITYLSNSTSQMRRSQPLDGATGH